VAIASFGVGHRSIYVGQKSFFVPSELIAWALAIVLLGQNALAGRASSVSVPKSIVFLVVWCLGALVWTPNVLVRWDPVLAMIKLWILALPVFYATANLITRLEQFKTVFRILILVALYMSVMDITEVMLPGIAAHFPWFFNLEFAFRDTQQGFVRSLMSFWGSPSGVIIIGWGILAAADEIFHGQEFLWKLLAIGTIALGTVAVYLAGQRDTWGTLAIALPIFVVLSDKRSAVVLLFCVPIIASFLPTNFWRRVSSALPFSSGFRADTDNLKRLHLYESALEKVKSNPLLGAGYSDDLVHNEFLAFAAHVGLPAAIAFIAFLAELLIRLWQTYTRPSLRGSKRYGRVFLALFITWMFDLNLHPVLGHPHLAAPYWFMLALAWQLSNLALDSSPRAASTTRGVV
jgi:O-antigen ligase